MRGLHHVEMYVSDLQKTKDFWVWFLEKLGYVTYQQWDAGISLKLDSTYLVFVQVEKKYNRGYHRCSVGLNHLAFHAPDRLFVDQLRQELVHRGIPLLYEDRFPEAGGQGTYGVFFEDPDRIKVEVVC